MAFKPREEGPFRDKTYPSQIAAERPALTTRVRCFEKPDADEALRGGEQPMHTETACERFNRELRAGHAGRNITER